MNKKGVWWLDENMTSSTHTSTKWTRHGMSVFCYYPLPEQCNSGLDAWRLGL